MFAAGDSLFSLVLFNCRKTKNKLFVSFRFDRFDDELSTVRSVCCFTVSCCFFVAASVTRIQSIVSLCDLRQVRTRTAAPLFLLLLHIFCWKKYDGDSNKSKFVPTLWLQK